MEVPSVTRPESSGTVGFRDRNGGHHRSESKRQKAFYSILQCIGQKYVPMVMSCDTPKKMWDTLC